MEVYGEKRIGWSRGLENSSLKREQKKRSQCEEEAEERPET